VNELHQRFGILEAGGAWILPVLHGKLEYADLVRGAVTELQPAAVAVELADTLRAPLIEAVRRLPRISVLLYEDHGGNSVYLPVEPADPLIEGLRSAIEAGVPAELVDLDVDYPLRHAEPFPDTYSLLRIGAGAYLDAYLDASAGQDGDELDRRRERGMAHRIQRLVDRHGEVLVVCGMAHARRLADDLTTPQPAPFARKKRDGVGLFHLHPRSLPETLTTFPFLSAVYERRRGDLPPDPDEATMAPPRKRAVRDFLAVVEGHKEDEPDERLGLSAAVDWVARRCGEPGEPLDRRLAHLRMLDRAALRYRSRTGEEVKPWQRRILQKFARNYALIDGYLVPDLYQLVVASRGAVDENHGHEVWDLGEHYPWQEETSELATIRVTAEQLMLGTRRIRLRRRIPVVKRRMVRVPMRKRKREKHPGEWLEHFDPLGLCSHPPEDLVIEDYGNYLRKKGVKIVGDEQSRVVPFTTSLLDGIDVRETVRNWHEKRIYVREERKVQGGVGSVVIIFDEDEHDERFPFRMTWLGEHDDESDMAFYSTPLADHLVGPGINRCEYGGLLLSYPPLRLMDVWEDPDYQQARTKSEVLLMAAVDYSLDPHVVYVAANPPRTALRTYAETHARKIVYLPIGQLSPTSIRNIRVFHILWGKDKREIARDYVW